MKKRCLGCGIEQTTENFYRQPRSPDGLRARCKLCDHEQHKVYYTRAKKRLNAQRRKRRNAGGREFKQHLSYNYKMSVEMYEQLYQKQNGTCAICHKLNLNGQRLHVDHDHVTGTIRGLLCGNCNRALGMFNDSSELMQRAAEYLANFNS